MARLAAVALGGLSAGIALGGSPATVYLGVLPCLAVTAGWIIVRRSGEFVGVRGRRLVYRSWWGIDRWIDLGGQGAFTHRSRFSRYPMVTVTTGGGATARLRGLTSADVERILAASGYACILESVGAGALPTQTWRYATDVFDVQG